MHCQLLRRLLSAVLGSLCGCMWLQDYYRAIRASLAVVPAFASDVYYTKKASSSVAAAMVCGTPLLAEPEMLEHYTYLSKVCTVGLWCLPPLSQLLPAAWATRCSRCVNWQMLSHCAGYGQQAWLARS